MVTHKQSIGQMGEEYAIRYLIDREFTILQHHFTTHWGEIDIIAKKGNKLYFIEVKTRVGSRSGKPYEAVNYFKLRSLKRAVQMYLLTHRRRERKFALDVISIELKPDFSVSSISYYDQIYSLC